jgi:hypothetical protein
MNLFSDVKVYWADISQVDATISLLKKIVEQKMDYVFFISGQDYLVKKDNDLLKYVNIKENYLEFFKLPNYKWGEDGRCNRYIYYHNIVNGNCIKKFNPRGRYYKYINRKLVEFQNKIKIKRKMVNDMVPFSGANWFNINFECAQYVVENYNSVRKFFKFVEFPDEMALQTIILNSNLKNKCVNTPLRYIDWYTGPEQPRTLTSEDYEKIINSDCIFARKFDIKKDAEILDMLDRYIGAK